MLSSVKISSGSLTLSDRDDILALLDPWVHRVDLNGWADGSRVELKVVMIRNA